MLCTDGLIITQQNGWISVLYLHFQNGHFTHLPTFQKHQNKFSMIPKTACREHPFHTFWPVSTSMRQNRRHWLGLKWIWPGLYCTWDYSPQWMSITRWELADSEGACSKESVIKRSSSCWRRSHGRGLFASKDSATCWFDRCRYVFVDFSFCTCHFCARKQRSDGCFFLFDRYWHEIWSQPGATFSHTCSGPRPSSARNPNWYSSLYFTFFGIF